jgi:hypothetical protein
MRLRVDDVAALIPEERAAEVHNPVLDIHGGIQADAAAAELVWALVVVAQGQELVLNTQIAEADLPSTAGTGST